MSSEGRIPTTEAEKAHWLTIMSQEEYDRIFEAPTRFEPDGIPDFILAMSGGRVNKPTEAANYAAALLHLQASMADIKAADLQATEIAGVWHVRRKAGAQEELLRFTRSTGKVLSDNFKAPLQPALNPNSIGSCNLSPASCRPEALACSKVRSRFAAGSDG